MGWICTKDKLPGKLQSVIVLSDFNSRAEDASATIGWYIGDDGPIILGRRYPWIIINYAPTIELDHWQPENIWASDREIIGWQPLPNISKRTVNKLARRP